MEEDQKSLLDQVKQWPKKIGVWLKPDPTDKPLVQVLKLLYKSIAVLVLIALSPLMLVVLLFVFFAAL